MLFTSLTFMAFLGVLAVLYYVVPHRFRWALLLVGSLYFYISWDWTLMPILLLIGVTLVTYACGRGMARTTDQTVKRRYLTVGLLANLGTLFVFKYLDFFLGQLGALMGVTMPQLRLPWPVGLSFYAFSAITYLVDVYRNVMESETSLGKLALYVSFFPKIFSGPIERARHFLPQLWERIQFDPANITLGLELIAWGLFKKAVIADRLAPFVTAAYSNPDYAPPLTLIIGTYFFGFQIYCDFSGYTDIARGVARLLGIDLLENFRRPFLSKSIGEFWAKRWHISLATWFRDYLYIPMGGSRVGWPRHYFNLMVIFVVSAIWHAGLGYGVSWAFFLWGLVNGLYVWGATAFTRAWRRAGSPLAKAAANPVLSVVRIVWTFHLWAFANIFFKASSIPDAFTIITRIYDGLGSLGKVIRVYPFTSEFFLSLGLIGLLMVFEILDEKKSVWERIHITPTAARWAVRYALVFGLIILGKWGQTEFIYMQF